jgi:hypothetical protein
MAGPAASAAAGVHAAMIQFWAVLQICVAAASGQLCGERIYTVPAPTFVDCALMIAQLQPIFAPTAFRCVEGDRPDLPPLQLVPASQQWG